MSWAFSPLFAEALTLSINWDTASVAVAVEDLTLLRFTQVDVEPIETLLDVVDLGLYYDRALATTPAIITLTLGSVVDRNTLVVEPIEINLATPDVIFIREYVLDVGQIVAALSVRPIDFTYTRLTTWIEADSESSAVWVEEAVEAPTFTSESSVDNVWEAEDD